MTVVDAIWRTVTNSSDQIASNVNGLASRDGNLYAATGWAFSPQASVYKITPAGVSTVVGDLGTARYDTATCIVEEADGKEYIYVIGGHNDSGNLNLVQKYDIAAGTHRTLPPLPTPREDAVAVHHGGKIFVIGGTNGSALNLVEVFDIATETWSTGKPTTYTHSAHSAVVYAGQIFVIGGRGTGAGKLEVFDTEFNVWATDRTGMPINSWHHGADVLGGHIFVLNGENDNDMWNDSVSRLFVYEISKDTWTELAAPPKGYDRHGFSFVKPKKDFSGKAYAFLGWDSGFNSSVHELSITIEPPYEIGYRQSHSQTSYAQNGGTIIIYTIAGNSAVGTIDDNPIVGATVTHELRLKNADGSTTRYKTLSDITGSDGRTRITNTFTTSYPKGDWIIATTITDKQGNSVRFSGYPFKLI